MFGGQLMMLGIVLAVFALLVVPSLTGNSSGAAASAGGAGAEPERASAAPAPDPTAEAFRAVRKGDCLSNHKAGAEWTSFVPRPVPCASGNAFVRVTGVVANAHNCPDGTGRAHFFYTDAGGRTTAVCFQREFRPGQCFVARLTDTPDGRVRMEEADLTVRLDCAATGTAIPEPHNTVLEITGVMPAPETEPARPCARSPQDGTTYWYWITNGDTELVCATHPEAAG
ncbi:hypothetical protein SAMN05421773_101674 [Streptomyces aidingensis]|uniref:Uncharacterized protein n=1 Tax=Streptomyces aidingensis TaxID=910347 RepID=A0A1I1FGJ7_9ACTN|nr:hypothetical protein SAMN05421773_101674 [Streptomyces aidingensis]